MSAKKKKSTEVVAAFKGFDKDLKCRGFQFEVGKTYAHDGPLEICASGFHACENPLDVWNYYKPGESRFASVSMSGQLAWHDEDSKIVGARIEITAELSMAEIITSAVKFVMGLCTASKETTATTGYVANAATTGYRANAATTGEKCIAAALGMASRAKAGPDGCLIVRSDAQDRPRVVVGYVGEGGIRPDTWYEAKGGELVEVES